MFYFFCRSKLRGIKPYRFRIVLQVIRVIRVICEICGLKTVVLSQEVEIEKSYKKHLGYAANERIKT